MKTNEAIGRADLVAIARELGAKVERVERHWMGRCPLHRGRHKLNELLIGARTGAFSCSTCGDAGDAIEFLRCAGKLTRKEALAFIRDRALAARYARDER